MSPQQPPTRSSSPLAPTINRHPGFCSSRSKNLAVLCLTIFLACLTCGRAQQVAHYDFEGNVLDTSGQACNGINNGVTFTTGVVGAQAGVFNGTSSYVDLNNPGSSGRLKATLPVTVSAWIYARITSGIQRIYSSDNSDNTSVIAGFDLSLNAGNLECEYGDAGGSGAAHRRTLTGSAVLATGQWYHVTAVIQGPTNMQLYVDGQPINGNYSGTGGAMAYTSTVHSKIGTSNTMNFFNGYIDDLQFYHGALAASQISLLAEGALGYWGFDEGTGTTTADATGNAFTGTLVNGPAWGAGISGDALSFNGTNNYVNLNNATDVNPLKPTALPITVGAWVYLNSTSGNQRIFSADNTDDTSVIAGYDFALNAGMLECDYGDAGGSYSTHRRTKIGTTTLATGKWYYLACVIAGPTNMHLYINGVDDGGTYGGTGGPMAYTAASSKIATSDTTYFFDGKLDEVSVCNIVLSPFELGAAETVGGGTVGSPAVGPQPSYGIGGTGFTLVKNWHFGTDGTIRNISDLNTHFQYHDQFGTFNNGNGNYGANTVAPDPEDAISGQPVEGTNTGGAPVRAFLTDSLRTYLVPLNGATTVSVTNQRGDAKNCGCGSFVAKWMLPSGGTRLKQDIIWETRVRYVTPPYFWFAIWNCGNPWNGGAEMDLVETFGYDNGGGYTNYDGRYWHSNSVSGTDQVNYSGFSSGMASVGINSFDGTQYHIWTLAYYKDGTYAFYVDGTQVQYGSQPYNWTEGANPGNPGENMTFLFDGAWGNVNVGGVSNKSLPASSLSGTYYEWNYSRVYLR